MNGVKEQRPIIGPKKNSINKQNRYVKQGYGAACEDNRALDCDKLHVTC